MQQNMDVKINNIISVVENFTKEYVVYDSRKNGQKAYNNGEYKEFISIEFNKKGNKKLIERLNEMGIDVTTYITYIDKKSLYVSKVSIYF